MSDLSIATQELFAKSFTYQVGLRMPITAMLLEHRRVEARGGYQIVYDLVKDDAVDEAQDYYEGEGMTVAQTSFLDQAKFDWKYVQMPVRYTVSDEIKNKLGESEVKRHDLVKLMVERAQDGIKRHLNKVLHTISSSDAGRSIQSIYDPLDHSRTYGTVASTTTVKTWWNGSSLAESWADRNTAMALALDNLRKIEMICGRYRPPTEKLYCFLPEALHSKLQGILEGSVYYEKSSNENSRLFKYGFKSFQVYGTEYVVDSWMTLNSQTAYAVWLNPEVMDLRFHPNRSFRMTEFVWQGQIAGGQDENVARILLAGNCCNKQPNAGMWKSNVS